MHASVYALCVCALMRMCLSEISKSLDGVSVSTSFAQSRVVSVSTSIKFPSFNRSQSRHPRNVPVSMSLGLNIQERGLNVCDSRANSMVLHKANGGWNLIIKRRLPCRKYETARLLPERRPVFSLKPRLEFARWLENHIR